MIEKTPLARDETSRYFLHNVGLADTWEHYCNELNGSIIGQVNGQILEFTLVFISQNIEVKIEGLRQISNINAGMKTGFAMKKSTTIEIRPFSFGHTNWKVYKNNFLFNFINSIKYNTKIFEGDKNYSIASKTLYTQDLIEINKLFNFLSPFSEIRKIISKESVLNVEYFNLLGVDSIKKILKHLKI